MGGGGWGGGALGGGVGLGGASVGCLVGGGVIVRRGKGVGSDVGEAIGHLIRNHNRAIVLPRQPPQQPPQLD